MSSNKLSKEDLDRFFAYKCKQCGKTMNAVDYYINEVCLDCCKKNQKEVTGK